MASRAGWGAAAVAVGGAVALMLALLLPATPEPGQPTPPRPAGRPTPIPGPAAAPAPTKRPRADPADYAPRDRQAGVDALKQQVAPRPPVDPDQVHDPDQGGVRAALFTRHPRLLDCYDDHVDTHGPLAGRWTVEITVTPDDTSDEPMLSARTLNQGEQVDDLDACVLDALDDARFAAPELARTVRLPVPLPSGG